MKQRLPKQVLILFLSGIILLLTQSTVSAQEEGSSPCAVNLQDAQAAFDRGQVEQVPTLLGECLKSGFTKEEQLTAYKLIIQTLLFQDKLAEADSAMLAFLKKNPEYELSPTDHSSFVTLYNTFQVKPIIQLSLHLGTNIPFMTLIDPGSVSSLVPIRKYSTSFLNLSGSLEIKVKVNQHFDLSIEPGLSQLKFSNKETFTDELISGITDYTETQTRVELPLSATYNFSSFGEITPYVRLGGGPALTLSAKATAVQNPTDLNNLIDRSGNELDRSDSRIRLDGFLQLGSGLKYKTKGGFLFAELRLNAGLLNQSVSGGSSREELVSYYFYADDKAFHLNALNFNLGYTQIFYKPSKRKE